MDRGFLAFESLLRFGMAVAGCAAIRRFLEATVGKRRNAVACLYSMRRYLNSMQFNYRNALSRAHPSNSSLGSWRGVRGQCHAAGKNLA